MVLSPETDHHWLRWCAMLRKGLSPCVQLLRMRAQRPRAFASLRLEFLWRRRSLAADIRRARLTSKSRMSPVSGISDTSRTVVWAGRSGSVSGSGGLAAVSAARAARWAALKPVQEVLTNG